MTNALAKLDKATQMLAEAKTLDDIKKISDIAEAARVYAKAAKLGVEAANNATEIKLIAERMAGEMLKKLERGKGGQPTHSKMERVEKSNYSEVLKDSEIPKTTAHRWQQLAEIPEKKFKAHIEEVKERGDELTTSGLLKEVKTEKRKEVYEQKVSRQLPNGVFQVIYADPPWEYSNSGFNQSAANQYPTMPTKDICDLQIEGMADSDAALFLWVTSPLLVDGITVMASWGFQYKASMIWVKDKAPGIGFWVNTKHEILLIGSKGSFVPTVKHDSVINGKVKEHSRKPDEFYELIESMYPKAKKLELFSRRARDGWSAWGNEK